MGLASTDAFYDLLLSSPTEYRDLLEALLVTETWFFRDPEAFATLGGLAMERWLPRHPEGKLRILSLPCSTGEEPYSAVMTLLDAGLSPTRFHVDAVDISKRAIAHARRGLFGKNAFRAKSLGFQEHYFRRVGADFLLNSSVRRLVLFFEGNLFDPGFAAPHPDYDIILCRNLLIYLDPNSQRRALQRIAQLLSPDGVLFVGAAEQPLAFDAGFAPALSPQAFACAKAAARRPQPYRASAVLAPPGPPETAYPENRFGASVAAFSELRQARRLADAGRLNEAAAICEIHLRKPRPSAQAYYLLGLIRDARGDSSAAQCYRRALYLQPDHYEAIVQLAVLAQNQGDPVAARNLQRRAERLQPHPATDL